MYMNDLSKSKLSDGATQNLNTAYARYTWKSDRNAFEGKWQLSFVLL